MEQIKKKLCSNKGETLAEVLVAALIGGIALLLLAAMIMSASRLVTRGEEKMRVYYRGMSAAETMGREGGPQSVTSGTVSIQWEQAGKPVRTVEVEAVTDKDSGFTAYEKKADE